MRLRNLIPASCHYTPVDLVAREEGMLAVDLNKLPLPPIGEHDAVVFSGVMEYLDDVPTVIDATSAVAPRIIVSYWILEKKPVIYRRRANGFANDYNEAEFLDLFEQKSYKLLDRKLWRDQILFHFEKIREI